MIKILETVTRLKRRNAKIGTKSCVLAAIATLSLTVVATASPVTGQISIGGYASPVGADMGSATGLDFASGGSDTISGTSGGIYSFGAGTGTFAALGGCTSDSGGCGTIKDIADFGTEAATTSFLTLNTGGPPVSFDLTSITDVTHTANLFGGSVTFTALGTINFAGFDSTLADLILTAQGNNIVSFSATTLVSPPGNGSTTPLPASLPLLGTGLGALGLLARRRKRKAQAATA